MTQGSIPAWRTLVPTQTELGRCYSWTVWRMKWRWWQTDLFFLGDLVATVWELHTWAQANLWPHLCYLFHHSLSILSWPSLSSPSSALLSPIHTPPSLSSPYSIFSFCSFLHLDILLSSLHAWSIGEQKRGRQPYMATESSTKLPIKPSALFISLPFLLFSLPFSPRFVVLEIEAKAMWMLGRCCIPGLQSFPFWDGV